MSPDSKDSPPQSPNPTLSYATALHIPAGAGISVSEAYRDGATLVVLNGSTLPQRCVLCGTASSGIPIRLTLTWDSSFRLTRVSTLELRKQAVLFAYLCRGHRAKWSLARRVGGVGVVAFISLMTAGISLAIASESSDVPRFTPAGILMMIAGFAGVIVSLFFFTLRSRTLSCKRIHEGYLYLEGAGENFLSSLPPTRPPFVAAPAACH